MLDYDPDFTCGSDEWVLTMSDDYGDGWNNAYWTWQDSSSTTIETGTLDDGHSGSACLTMSSTDNCYVLKISSGSYDYEISWSLADSEGTTYLTGGAPGSSSVCAPTSSPTVSPGPTVSSVPTFMPTPLPTTSLPRPVEHAAHGVKLP